MKRHLLAAIAAVTVLAGATAASASTFLTLGAPAVDGSISGVFGQTSTTGMGVFTDTFTFSLPAGGDLVGALTTSATQVHGSPVPTTNVDFLSASLNGHPFMLSPTGQFEHGSVDVSTLVGLQTLVITYRAYAAGATYSGTLAFTPIATPEPGTWGMMLIGLLAVGAVARAHYREDKKLRALEAPID